LNHQERGSRRGFFNHAAGYNACNPRQPCNANYYYFILHSLLYLPRDDLVHFTNQSTSQRQMSVPFTRHPAT